VPPGVVHAYRNISRTERGTVLNYPDTLYAGWGKSEPVDEVRHEVEGDPFFVDFLHT
jgi:dTDP-4-dehydrorhamnose 3,5-epimerase